MGQGPEPALQGWRTPSQADARRLAALPTSEQPFCPKQRRAAAPTPLGSRSVPGPSPQDFYQEWIPASYGIVSGGTDLSRERGGISSTTGSHLPVTAEDVLWDSGLLPGVVCPPGMLFWFLTCWVSSLCQGPTLQVNTYSLIYPTF